MCLKQAGKCLAASSDLHLQSFKDVSDTQSALKSKKINTIMQIIYVINGTDTQTITQLADVAPKLI